jgi:hypothetical protein
MQQVPGLAKHEGPAFCGFQQNKMRVWQRRVCAMTHKAIPQQTPASPLWVVDANVRYRTADGGTTCQSLRARDLNATAGCIELAQR